MPWPHPFRHRKRSPSSAQQASCALRSTLVIRFSRPATQAANRADLSVDLAREAGRRLGLPVELVLFNSAGSVVEAVKARQVDLAFVAIDPVRATDMEYTAPYVIIEGAYVVRNSSALQRNDEVDRTRYPRRCRSRQCLRPLPHARTQVGDAGPCPDVDRSHRPVSRAKPGSGRRRETAVGSRRAARGRRAPAARTFHGDRVRPWRCPRADRRRRPG